MGWQRCASAACSRKPPTFNICTKRNLLTASTCWLRWLPRRPCRIRSLSRTTLPRHSRRGNSFATGSPNWVSDKRRVPRTSSWDTSATAPSKCATPCATKPFSSATAATKFRTASASQPVRVNRPKPYSMSWRKSGEGSDHLRHGRRAGRRERVLSRHHSGNRETLHRQRAFPRGNSGLEKSRRLERRLATLHAHDPGARRQHSLRRSGRSLPDVVSG